MSRKIALLRGINVGAHRRIKMADLRAALRNFGLTNIATYIQSGNIAFNSVESNHAILADQIQTVILEEFGHDVPVVVCDQSELVKRAHTHPFLSHTEDDMKSCYMTFLHQLPDPQSVAAFQANPLADEKFEISDQFVYLYISGPYHKCRLNNSHIEKMLQVTATTRNLKTVQRLLTL